MGAFDFDTAQAGEDAQVIHSAQIPVHIGPLDNGTHMPQKVFAGLGESLALNSNASGVGSNKAKHHSHSGAFSGAILAKKAVYIAGFYCKRQVLDCGDMAEMLRQITDLEDGRQDSE